MYDLEEQESIDALKHFWNQYGRLVITAAVAFVVGVAGIQGWNYWTRTQAERASALFGRLEEAERKSDLNEMRRLGAELIDKYPRSAYGPMAALVLAKTNYLNADRAGAAKQLQWAVDHAGDEDLRALARLRLAGVLLDDKKYDEALRLLETKTSDAFVAPYADLRGDVLAAQGKAAEARAAYRQALDKIAAGDPLRNVIQVKLDALGPGK
ncbi:MAG TPA: tetratricopeptide repeat protein [Burkholderiales bacterium]|nr:tetratricopeptide repeat protein [Burkholderiales bacterium]